MEVLGFSWYVMVVVQCEGAHKIGSNCGHLSLLLILCLELRNMLMRLCLKKHGFEPSDTTVEVSMIGVLIVVVNLGNYLTQCSKLLLMRLRKGSPMLKMCS